MKTTWQKQLDEAAADDVIVARAPDDSDAWDAPFDNGYGGSEGKNVLAWSSTRVYFPVVYDGSEWMEWAPRNPQAEGQGHVGGQ